MVELDPAGKEVAGHKITTLANTDFVWGEPTTIDLGLVSATQRALMATFDIDGTPVILFVTVVIAESDASVEFAGVKLEVPSNTLKWSSLIKNWPFASPDNRLALSVWIKNKEKADVSRISKSSDSFDFSESCSMDIVPFAIADGSNVPVNTSLTTRGKNYIMTFTFPSFSDSIWFDPVLSIDGDSLSVSSSISIFTLMMATLSVLF